MRISPLNEILLRLNMPNDDKRLVGHTIAGRAHTICDAGSLVLDGPVTSVISILIIFKFLHTVSPVVVVVE